MLSRRDFIHTTALTAAASMLPARLSSAPARPRPNVLFLMIDDLCCRLGCYGGEIRSPHIDRLAARGVRFERNYCQYPVCNPSRASLLTSLRPRTTGIVTNHEDDSIRHRLPHAVTLPQLFRQNGYYTSSQGKISHTGADEQGKPRLEYDAASWVRRTDVHGEEEELIRAGRGTGESFTPKLHDPHQPDWCRWFAGDWPDSAQTDAHVATQAIRELEQHRHEPFFIAAGFSKPHDPYVAPQRYFDLYPPGSLSLPSIPADRTPPVPLAFERAGWFTAFSAADRLRAKHAYCAGASYTDAQIGRVLDALDRHRLWDNTIVVVLADHGYELWEHEWLVKNTLFEDCARVPLIVWAPERRGMGRSAAGLTESLDVYPTLAELCGLTPPAQIEGASFATRLDAPDEPGKRAAFTMIGVPNPKASRWPRNGRSVRTERWRYNEWTDGHAELYDQNVDPHNYRNLANDPVHRDRCTELGELLRSNGSAHPMTQAS